MVYKHSFVRSTSVGRAAWSVAGVPIQRHHICLGKLGERPTVHALGGFGTLKSRSWSYVLDIFGRRSTIYVRIGAKVVANHPDMGCGRLCSGAADEAGCPSSFQHKDLNHVTVYFTRFKFISSTKMRHKRAKAYKRLMALYHLSFGFREPYQVLGEFDLLRTMPF
jgi:hypothetical protein